MEYQKSAMLAEPAAVTFEAAAMDPDARLMQEELERAQRVASGHLEAQDLHWLSKGFSAFLSSGGALPLERCLRLPMKDGSLRRACRDYWLRRAWKLIGGDLSPWRRSEALAGMVRSFEARQWARWRLLQAPPDDAGELEAALFHAFRAWERIPATAMQLHNIARLRRNS